ncbi:hypothetical protein BW75_05130 [Escherichia coli O81:NM str. 02-3012]|nr:hypothetical protein BW75_05130 [Escherichia coli O81:NM str. 02-3012]
MMATGVFTRRCGSAIRMKFVLKLTGVVRPDQQNALKRCVRTTVISRMKKVLWGAMFSAMPAPPA